MTYPGNSSLSEDIQERIQSTYQQTLELAAQGNRQEASLGCDFILRLDAEFTPAHKLLERLEDGEGPVQVDDLRPGAPGYAQAPAGVGAAEAAQPAESAEMEEDGGVSGLSRSELKAELHSLLEAGDHEEVVLLAQAERDRVMEDPELQEIARTAQNRQEADPYIQSFLGKAREALRHEEGEQARRYLENARELDPEHPAIRDFAAVLEARGVGEAEPQSAEDEEVAEPEAPLAEGFSLEETSGGDESDARIRELLAEGQAAFDRGEHQEAIDAWSRIFLIDIDHPEAARRIEKARSLKDERERQVEETFHDAVSKLEAGQTEEAKASLQEVLELQPSHLAAREYLQELEEGRAPAAGPPKTKAALADGLAMPEPEDEEPLSHEILIPPEPGEPSGAAEVPAGARASAASSSPSVAPSRTFLWVGGVVLLLVVAAAWFFFQRRDSLFPNASEDVAVQAGATLDPIEQAIRLHDAGRTEQALARLRQIPPEAEQFDDAQALISQWQAEAASAGDAAMESTEPASSGMQTERADQRGQLIRRVQELLDSGENLRALDVLDRADSISPLVNEEVRLRQRAQDALEPVSSELGLVQGGDWEFALRGLWRLHENNPGNPDVVRLLTTAYHNLGVRDLQRGDVEGAAESFEEALRFQPGDPELQRHLSFARAYRQRGKDLLYEIYARKLSFRAP